MSDSISRQDAIDAICESGVREERKGHLSMSMITAKQWAVDVIEQLPSAERTGHWIMLTSKSAKCSECGNIHTTNGKDMTMKWHIFYAIYRYCPHCGCRMKEVEHE